MTTVSVLPAYFDRVMETTTTTGTGAISLAGAETGYQAFSAVFANGATFCYCIAGQASGADPGDWEVGLGTYATTGDLLNRVTVLASSNAGALTSFATGTKDVFCTLPATRFLDLWSQPGYIWTGQTIITAPVYEEICYGNGVFVAVGNPGISYSTDGVTWTVATSSLAFGGVCYGNGTFVAVVNGAATVQISTNGITWTTITVPTSAAWSDVCYGNGLFVAVAATAAATSVMSSPDGITWTAGTTAANNTWTAVCYGNGTFVAVSDSGSANRVMTSSNGTTWATQTSAANNNWTSIAYGNGIFVAVSNSGTSTDVMTSVLGTSWATQTPASTNNWQDITYGAGIFAAVANGETGLDVMTSPNGITWTSRPEPVLKLWIAITFGNGLFVAVGAGGTSTDAMISGTLTSRSDSINYGVFNGGITLHGGPMTINGIPTANQPAVSPANSMVEYYDLGLSVTMMSENGGAYAMAPSAGRLYALMQRYALQ